MSAMSKKWIVSSGYNTYLHPLGNLKCGTQQLRYDKKIYLTWSELTPEETLHCCCFCADFIKGVGV